MHRLTIWTLQCPRLVHEGARDCCTPRVSGAKRMSRLVCRVDSRSASLFTILATSIAATHRTSTRLCRLKPIVVILADDSPGDVMLNRQALAEEPCPVRCYVATDGAQALQLLTRMDMHPDLMILDLNMPKVSQPIPGTISSILPRGSV
jgi:PleD family two-component response regulator